MKIWSYNNYSKGAKALALSLKCKLLKHEGSKYRHEVGNRVINWGSRNCPFPDALNGNNIEMGNAINKLRFFQRMKEQGNEDIIPAFYRKQADIPDDAFPVVCRTNLTSHSGRGIVFADNRGELVAAPLYTRYEKKKDEYRVHVGRGGVVIDVQKKAKRNGAGDVDHRLRNHAGGFIYMRDGINTPDSVVNAAKRTLAAFDLDFGAVDVIYNAYYRKPYVLEINTAPGVEGSTTKAYRKYFEEVI